MKYNYTYELPTKLYFGKTNYSLDNLEIELENYGKNICLVYGMGSIKKNGLYDLIKEKLNKLNKTVFEISGVMPNPTVDLLQESIRSLKDINIDLILSVGGGSVHDFSKALSIGLTDTSSNIFEKYWVKQKNYPTLDNKPIPVGVVSTNLGAGSEMNSSSVLSNDNFKLELVFNDCVRPKFAIVNPEFCYSLTRQDLAYGIFDVIIHILEQFFANDIFCATDYLAIGMLKSIRDSINFLYSSNLPLDNFYNELSDLMWNSIYACNSLLSKGKLTDWGLHIIAQNYSGFTNITHGKALSIFAVKYYDKLLSKNISTNKFDMFFNELGNCRDFLKNIIKKLDIKVNLIDLTKQNFEELLNLTNSMKVGNLIYLSKNDIKEILYVINIIN